MAKKFLSNIELDAGLVDASNSLGSSGQILSSTGSTVSWIDNVADSAASADKALSLTITVKNTESVALTKGQVVCPAPSATPPSGNVIEVKLADNNGTDSMPAIGILNEGLDAAGGTNDEGEAIMFGRISGIDTSAFSVGDEVFVSDTAGALTATKPTGVKYIQKIGVIMRDDASNGTIEVFGAGRTNDVPTPLYIDHDNQRVGIGTTSPSAKLDITQTEDSEGIIIRSSVVQPEISFVDDSTGDSFSIGHNRAGNRMDIEINGTDTHTFTQAGKVGIGTINPGATLEVAKGGEGDYLIVGGDNASNGRALVFTSSTATSNGALHTINAQSGNGQIAFKTGGTEALRIDSSQNVGIGTDNPGEKLHVDGNILVDSVLLSNQENTDVDSAAAEMVAQVAIATYTAVFFDFVIKKGTNIRSGTVYACHDGTNVEFTETSTQDLGDTSDVTLSVDISSNNIRLVATVTSDDWSIKTLVRAI